MSEIVIESPGGYLMAQFLAWLDESPRTYGEVMDVWRTSCPRLSIWEDARIDGLVRLGSGSGRDRRVALTPEGRAFVPQPLPSAGSR